MLEKLNHYISRNESDLALEMLSQLKLKKLEPSVLQKLEVLEFDILIEKNYLRY